MVVRRDGIRKNNDARVAVGALQIAQDLIVGAILLHDVDDVFDLAAQRRDDGAWRRRRCETVVFIDEVAQLSEVRDARNGRRDQIRFLQRKHVLILMRRIEAAIRSIHMRRKEAGMGGAIPFASVIAKWSPP